MASLSIESVLRLLHFDCRLIMFTITWEMHNCCVVVICFVSWLQKDKAGNTSCWDQTNALIPTSVLADFQAYRAPAGAQRQALCCCGAWSRARWRGGGGRERPRPGAAGEARSAFGLWRLQTAGGQRGTNLTTSRRRRRRRRRRQAGRRRSWSNWWWRQYGGPQTRQHICNTLSPKWYNCKQIFCKWYSSSKSFLVKGVRSCSLSSIRLSDFIQPIY